MQRRRRARQLAIMIGWTARCFLKTEPRSRRVLHCGIKSLSGGTLTLPYRDGVRRCRGPHLRAVHGDPLEHHSDRPDQANRDQDSDPCAHCHPLYIRVELCEHSPIPKITKSARTRTSDRGSRFPSNVSYPSRAPRVTKQITFRETLAALCSRLCRQSPARSLGQI